MGGNGRSANSALRAALCCALFTVVIMSGRARAQPSAADAPQAAGTILQLDGADVLLDLGSAQLDRAQQLTVYRAIEVRHPVTGKRLRDRFPIGHVSVVQAGQTLSIARAVDTPEHPFVVGDQVERDPPPGAAGTSDSGGRTANDTSRKASEARASTAAASSSDAPAESREQLAVVSRALETDAPHARATRAIADKSAGTLTAEQSALGEAWFGTLGKPPAARAQIYANFLRRYPSTGYRETLEQEIRVLRALFDSVKEAQQARAARARQTDLPTLALQPVSGARVAEAIHLAGLLHTQVPLRSIVLYARPLDARAYQPYPLQPASGNHVRVQLPAALARSPGFGYFVEGVDEAGHVLALAGSADSPRLLPVFESDAAHARQPLRTRVRFSSELVSFDGTSGRDYFLVSEGDFFYRLELGPLIGLRVGYGNYTGRGGTVDQLDRQGLPPQAAGFTYGFVESELGLHRLIGVALRATVGLGRPDDGAQTHSELTGGFQLRTRFGEAQGTHLVLAGELMPEIGQRAYLGLHFEAIRSLPMAAEVVVTDQPVHSKELAVRLVYELGYRVSPRVALALRASYQLRTIAHAGPGLGLAASFDF